LGTYANKSILLNVVTNRLLELQQELILSKFARNYVDSMFLKIRKF